MLDKRHPKFPVGSKVCNASFLIPGKVWEVTSWDGVWYHLVDEAGVVLFSPEAFLELVERGREQSLP